MDAVSQATEASDPATLTGNNNLMALQQQMDQSFLNRGQHLEELAKEIEAKAKAAAEKVAANAAELRKVRGVPDDPVRPLACFERKSALSEQPVDPSSRDRSRNQDRSPSITRDDHPRNRTRRPRHRNRSRNSTRTAKTNAEEPIDSHQSSRQRGRSRERTPALHVESKADDHSRDRAVRRNHRIRSRDRGACVTRGRSRNYDVGRRSRSRERRRRRSRSEDRTSSRNHDRRTDTKYKSSGVQNDGWTDRKDRSKDVEAWAKIGLSKGDEPRENRVTGEST